MNKLPDLKGFKSIAIIQTAFLGDVALALYLSETIKKFYNEIDLTFVTTPAAASFVSCAKSIDHVITYDKRGLHSGLHGIKFIAEDLRERNIECIFSPHRSLRSTLVTYLAKPRYSVGFDKNAMSFLYKKRVKYRRGVHETERNASLLSAFNDTKDLQNINYAVELDIPDDDKTFIENKLSNKGIKESDKIIAVAPGTVWETKRWLPEYYGVVINKLSENGYTPILIGSKDDRALAEEISAKIGAVNLSGEISLPQLIYFLSLCCLTITNDSAPTHFAGLAKCPTLTIFGATIPEFGFGPRGIYDRSIGIEGLKCRPCAIHGGRKCPVKNFDCMVKLTPELVLKDVMDILFISGKSIEGHTD
ncbi:glycosyltransferase family 9 protein [Bacteroidota bacterium]